MVSGEQWESMPIVGVQDWPGEDAPAIELRNCTHCNSTLAKEVDSGQA